MELYLDNAATTAIHELVLKEYIDLISKYYGSTGSLHRLGEISLEYETTSKNKIASLLKVKPSEIFFNTGATEGNNYAIKGVAFNYKKRGKTIITTKIEHPSVYQCVKQLENDYGFNCIYLDVNEKGVIDLNQLSSLMSDDVILVSIMYVNHEVGSIMPIKQISNILKKYPKAIFHSDITQALGKTPVDLSYLDIATMSAHKIHGLKGSGFIYKKEKVSFYPLISGHSARNTLRAGTSNWPSNTVMSKALELSLINMKENYMALKQTQEKLISKLKEIDGIVINNDCNYSIPSIVNFSVLKCNPEVIIRFLSNKNIYVSSRSVCSSEKKDQISQTLKAMNKSMDVCISSIRVSYFTPLDDNQINYFIDSLKEAIKIVKR